MRKPFTKCDVQFDWAGRTWYAVVSYRYYPGCSATLEHPGDCEDWDVEHLDLTGTAPQYPTESGDIPLPGVRLSLWDLPEDTQIRVLEQLAGYTGVNP